MLKITFVTMKQDAPKIGRNLMEFVHKYTNFHGAFEPCLVGFELVLIDCELWSDAKQVIDTFETINRNSDKKATVLNLTFS